MWQSLNGTPSSTISILPGYVSTGFYAVSGDQQCVRKKAMGAIIQDDRLNQAGSLRFRVMRDGDDIESDVRPGLPVGPAVYGATFRFSLVFGRFPASRPSSHSARRTPNLRSISAAPTDSPEQEWNATFQSA